MSLAEVIIRLFAVAILAGYLLLKHQQRVRSRPAPKDSHLTGRALDAAQLQPRIRQLRHDYLTELHSSSRTVSFRRGLIARARRTLGCLPYFRDKRAEHENQTHAAS